MGSGDDIEHDLEEAELGRPAMASRIAGRADEKIFAAVGAPFHEHDRVDIGESGWVCRRC